MHSLAVVSPFQGFRSGVDRQPRATLTLFACPGLACCCHVVAEAVETWGAGVYSWRPKKERKLFSDAGNKWAYLPIYTLVANSAVRFSRGMANCG